MFITNRKHCPECGNVTSLEVKKLTNKFLLGISLVVASLVILVLELVRL